MKQILAKIYSFKDNLPEFSLNNRFQVTVTVLAALAIAYAGVDTSISLSRLTVRKNVADHKPAQRGSAVQTKQPAASESYEVIVQKNLFGSSSKPISAGFGDAVFAAPTTLQLELLGTIAGKNNYGYAIIEERDKKKQSLFKVGDSVAGAKIKEIKRNTVIIRVGENDEVLEMKTSPRDAFSAPGQALAGKTSASQTSGRTGVNLSAGGLLPASSGDHVAIKEVREMISDGQAKPQFVSGRMEGLIVNKVKEGSYLKKSGLQDGDIIQSINNRKIDNPNDIAWIQTLLSSPGEKVSLQVNRSGKQVDLSLN